MPQVLKEEVLKRILKAATQEFFNKGYNKSSLRSISKVAGVTPGNLYRYFEGKESIYEAVVGDSYKRLNEILKASTDNQIKIDHQPLAAYIHNQENEYFEIIVSNIVSEVVKVFSKNKMGLLILLRDDREDNTMKARYGLQNWVKSNFDILYKDLNIGEHLAYSFTEGIIKIALKEDVELESKIDSFVKFFFIRKVESYE